MARTSDIDIFLRHKPLIHIGAFGREMCSFNNRDDADNAVAEIKSDIPPMHRHKYVWTLARNTKNNLLYFYPGWYLADNAKYYVCKLPWKEDMQRPLSFEPRKGKKILS